MFAQAGGAIDPQTGAVVPPLNAATTFVRDENYDLLSADHSYARDQNDLYRLAESLLAKAEHAEDGLLLPSGMAAVASVVRTVPNGGRIIMQSGIYWGATSWTRDFCARRNIELIEVDCSEIKKRLARCARIPVRGNAWRIAGSARRRIRVVCKAEVQRRVSEQFLGLCRNTLCRIGAKPVQPAPIAQCEKPESPNAA